jgi:putative ABC transport system substrate-binding protein
MLIWAKLAEQSDKEGWPAARFLAALAEHETPGKRNSLSKSSTQAAQAQQTDRLRRVGVLTAFDENDPRTKTWISRFTLGLGAAGWVDGRNVRTEIRWSAGDFDRMEMFAKELVDLQPDVIFAATTSATVALHRNTRTIPIVFALVSDPVGERFVASVPRPEGNITGFCNVEPSMAGKWLELLVEMAPGVKRAAIMFNPDTATYGRSYFLPSFEASARSLRVEPIIARVHSAADIEMVVASLGREPRGGLVALPDSFFTAHRAQIISLAALNNVPTVSPDDIFARDGGLLSYGANILDEFRRAALYVDRILRGAKPADLPVQYPTKYEMVLNAKTAKALGLAVPISIELRADEVIE